MGEGKKMTQNGKIKELQEKAERSLCKLLPVANGCFRDTDLTIQYRVKTRESIMEKCLKKNMAPEELTDLLGIRIIGKPKDFGRILKKVFENFNVTQVEDFWFHTTDLGYRSFHVLIDVDGFCVELQIHTAVSSAFALLCHGFYKTCREKCCSSELLSQLKLGLEKEAQDVNGEHLVLKNLTLMNGGKLL